MSPRSPVLLGIFDGHNASAGVYVENRVVSLVQEERLVRVKNHYGLPEQAAVEALRLAGVTAAEVDRVCCASRYVSRPQGPSWATASFEARYRGGVAHTVRQRISGTGAYRQRRARQRMAERASAIGAWGYAPDKVTFTDHHETHAATAYHGLRHDEEPYLVLTLDGGGDGLSGSVWIGRDGLLECQERIPQADSLGELYAVTTHLLGFTPLEHEYKLMGMAPYAHSERVDSALAPLHQLLRLSDDGLRFEQAGELSTNFSYEYLRDAFERVRFDTICGAAQRFTEEMLVAWVKACVAKTGIRKIVAGGGVFMNVKANMLIAALPEVERLYVMPTSGDESLSIGAAMHQFYTRTGEADHRRSALTDLYFGGEATVREEEQAIAAAGTDLDVRQTDDMPGAVADLLAAGEIVANCRGRMEWGARSLGNRSILASADEFGRIGVINRMIKMRDFWMPFAPSMTDQSSARYFDDPKDLKPWFMTFAYAAKDAGYDHLIAGSHPHDRTIRPQVVTRRANPDYHAVIEKFEAKTGRGVVLNTSFNLHGEPIVYGPADAMRVLLTSGLEHLALNNFIVSKKSV